MIMMVVIFANDVTMEEEVASVHGKPQMKSQGGQVWCRRSSGVKL